MPSRTPMTEYTIFKIFSLFRIFEQLALAFKNRVFPQNFHYIEYIFLAIQDFWATLRLPWKTEFALKIFTVFNIRFTLRIFEQLALALNSLYWECRPSIWSAAAENSNEICKVKARLWAVLQITSAQQHTSIHFILPRLKLNRTGGSTHWRKENKTWSIRSTRVTDSLQGYGEATTSN